MARKFLTPIDLAKNELQNAKIGNLASAPSSPVAGQIYWDTTLHQFGVYNDNTSSWVYLGSGTGSVTTVSVASANGFSGTVANASSTPAITMQTTITGVLKGNGTAISAATSGTDYAPATSGSAILKGNGSGGFSSATSGTDYAPATTGSSALKASSGGFATATINDLGAQTADYSASSHKITNLTDPTSAQDAATKAYVDSAAAGIDWKASVRAATTVAGTLASSFANGSVIDGVTLATGNRILIKNQSTGSENGIYVVAASGAPTRATDADANAEVTPGLAVFVEEGTTQADTGWVMTNTGAVTVGTTALTFVQFTGLGEVTAGTGLSKSGNTMSIDTTVTVDKTTSQALTNKDLTSGTNTFPTFNQNTTGSAAKLTTARNINGVAFDGTAAITIPSTKATGTLGNASSTSFAITDSLGSIDKIAIVRDASTGAQVECDITYSSTQTTFAFAVAPATNAYNYVIMV